MSRAEKEQQGEIIAEIALGDQSLRREKMSIVEMEGLRRWPVSRPRRS